jgi:hypothetical protein
MSILHVLKVIGALLTIGTGVISLLFPQAVTGFTGLLPQGGRGVTEIRSVLGGLFIALGAAPLLFNQPVAYQVLGLGYLTIGVVRLVSMIVDKSVVSSNVISLVFEFVFGVILVV